MSKRIYIECSVMGRELDARIMMAIVAARKGYIVYVGRNTCIRNIAYTDRNQAYVGTNFSIPSLKRYEKLKAQGHNLFALDEEATAETCETYHSRRSSRKVAEIIDGVFANSRWHEKQTKKWLDSRELQKKIYYTGNPRFEMCKKKYIGLYKASESIKKKRGEFVLATTNGSIQAQYNLDANVGKLCSRGELASDLVSTYRDNINYRAEEQRLFISRIIRLVNDESGVKLILRVKPGEEQYIANEFPQIKKHIELCNDGNIVEWVHASEGVIGNYCTTLIEARFAGKPAINFISDLRRKRCNEFLDKLVPSVDEELAVKSFLFDRRSFAFLEGGGDEFAVSPIGNIMNIIGGKETAPIEKNRLGGVLEFIFYLKSIGKLVLFCRNAHQRGGPMDYNRVRCIVEQINAMSAIEKKIRYKKVAREVLVFW